MKSTLASLALTLLVSSAVVAADPPNVTQDPAYLPIDKVLDLKVVKPEVNVNLPKFLLMDAVSELDLGTNSAFAASGISLADLIRDIKLIRLLVISGDKSNKDQLDKAVTTLNKHLETNWTAIVSVPEENIGVYAMSDPAGESVTGLALLIHNDGDTIIGNIVGRISIGKILKVASKFDHKSGASFIPKELMEKLAGISAGAKDGGAKEGSGKESGSADKKAQ